MMKKGLPAEPVRVRVRLFLSLEPPRFIEGTVTLSSAKARLSDMMNDEKTFLAIQDVTAADIWIPSLSKFMLLNKQEIKAIAELD